MFSVRSNRFDISFEPIIPYLVEGELIYNVFLLEAALVSGSNDLKGSDGSALLNADSAAKFAVENIIVVHTSKPPTVPV